MIWNFIIQAVIMLASMAYQRRRQKKMQARMEAEAEKRKGFEVPVDGEAINLPLVYGYQKIAGVRAVVHVANNGEIKPLPSGFTDKEKNLEVGVKTGSKKEYMLIQQAFCYGDIESVIDIEVDGQNWNDSEFWHHIRYSLNGGTADPTAKEFNVPDGETNKFTNMFWANMVFKLNRDDPQYNSTPEVLMYIKGTKVRDITFTNGAYQFANTYTFSNNAALVLADYLTRPEDKGGCGFKDSQINLESFGKAKVICDTVVDSAAKVRGRVNGIRPVKDGQNEPDPVTRTVRLYECNFSVDTANSRRDNIDALLETMAQSELVYSEGQYKLVLDYPTTVAQQDALITATYTDDDILGKIEVANAGADSRFNYAVVKFRNESVDFKTDSVSWPVRGSAAHTQYMNEDNNIPNETTYTLQGGTQRKLALAKAEEIVRASRIGKTIKFSVPNYALVHEVGDLIKVNSVAGRITNELFRISAIRVSPTDLSVSIEADRFDKDTLAWNVSDDYVEPPIVIPGTVVPNVTNLQWTKGQRRLNRPANGYLTWTNPTTTDVRRLHIWAKKPADSDWEKIGQTSRQFFDIPADFNTAGHDYQFLVKTENSSGYLSQGAMVLADQMPNLVPVNNVTKEVGVNTVKLTWQNANPELVGAYKVYYGTSNVRSSAQLFGTTIDTEMVVSPLVPATYYFWVDAFGEDGSVAAMNTPISVSKLELSLKSGDISEDSIDWSHLANDVRSDMEGFMNSANASMLAANTFMHVANTHAHAANTSKTEAGNYASASYQHSIKNALGRSHYEPGKFDPWSNTFTSVVAVTGHPNGQAYALRQSNRDVYSTTEINEQLKDRVYRITGVVDNSQNPYQARVGFRIKKEDDISAWPTSIAAEANEAVKRFDVTLSLPNAEYANSKWFTFFLQSNGPAGSGHQVDWSEIRYEDITESVKSANSASAAATSASQASASANSSAQSAAASANSATTANTHAGTAKTYRDEAAQSKTDAAGSASSAATQAGIAVTASNTANRTAADMLPHDFKEDGKFWRSVSSGVPYGTNAGPEAPWAFKDVTGVGRVVYNPSGGTKSVYQQGVIKQVEGRKIKLTLRGRVVTTQTGSWVVNCFLRQLNESYGYVDVAAGSWGTFGFTKDWKDFSVTYTVPANHEPYVRGGFYTRGDTTYPGEVQVEFFKVEDVTESVSAAGSASAASTSASNAAASANSSAQSASAATSAKTAAETARSGAETYRNEAATSATNAATSASAAGTIEGTLTKLIGSENFDNPVLKNWTGSLPTGFTGVVTEANRTFSHNKTAGKYYGYLQFNCDTAGGSANRPYIDIRSGAGGSLILPDDPMNSEGVRILAEVEKVSGSSGWGGACIRVSWVPSGTGGVWAHKYYFFKENLGTKDGLLQTVEFDAFRPSTFQKGSDGGLVRVFIFGNSNYESHTPTVIKWRLHRLSARSITKGASTFIQQKSISDIEGSMAASITMRATSNTANASLELVALNAAATGTSASQARISADNILLDGSVRVPQLTIDEQLKINDENGSFSFGKTGVNDFANNGLWFGRNTSQDGSVGFGFFAGRTSGGEEQYIQISRDDGLQLRNAQFRIGAGIAAATNITSSQTYTFQAGTKEFSLTLVGGGGGGQGGGNTPGSSGSAGSSGGTTTVILRDGTTNIATYTAAGGSGGSGGNGTSTYGKNGLSSAKSPYGDSGRGGNAVSEPGYKGIGGDNGSVGQIKSWNNIDISGLTDPKLVITIGGGGNGGSGFQAGDKGKGGKVEISSEGDAILKAGPVSYTPSLSGSYSYTASSYKNLPAKGGARAAYYLLTNVQAGAKIDLLNGVIINVTHNGHIGFFTENRPKYQHSNNRTINYYIYPVG